MWCVDYFLYLNYYSFIKSTSVSYIEHLVTEDVMYLINYIERKMFGNYKQTFQKSLFCVSLFQDTLIDWLIIYIFTSTFIIYFFPVDITAELTDSIFPSNSTEFTFTAGTDIPSSVCITVSAIEDRVLASTDYKLYFACLSYICHHTGCTM